MEDDHPEFSLEWLLGSRSKKMGLVLHLWIFRALWESCWRLHSRDKVALMWNSGGLAGGKVCVVSL